MDLQDINIQLQALLAITLIIGAISGFITWIAGQMAEKKFNAFRTDLLSSLDGTYAKKGELENLQKTVDRLERKVDRLLGFDGAAREALD